MWPSTSSKRILACPCLQQTPRGLQIRYINKKRSDRRRQMDAAWAKIVALASGDSPLHLTPECTAAANTLKRRIDALEAQKDAQTPTPDTSHEHLERLAMYATAWIVCRTAAWRTGPLRPAQPTPTGTAIESPWATSNPSSSAINASNRCPKHPLHRHLTRCSCRVSSGLHRISST